VAVKPGRSVELEASSSAELRVGAGNKLKFTFSKKDPFLGVSRWKFRNVGELEDHLAKLLSRLDLRQVSAS
jgi:hypothetical protein